MANKVFMTKDEHSEGIGVSSYKKGDDRSLWRYAEGDSALSIMAHSMPNSQTKEVETRDSLTVPSPWSNIITFDLLLDNIIYNPTGRSKEINYGFIQDKTENEWKVLITLVALRKMRSINLEFETVDLEKLRAMQTVILQVTLQVKALFRHRQYLLMFKRLGVNLL